MKKHTHLKYFYTHMNTLIPWDFICQYAVVSPFIMDSVSVRHLLNKEALNGLHMELLV